MSELSELRLALKTRIHALIDACAHGARAEPERDALLHDLQAFQCRNVEAYGRFASQRRVHAQARGVDALPALPTDAFRFARIAGHAESEDVRRFMSSGTTQDARSQHVFRDLSMYDHAAEVAARYALFPDLKRMRLVILAPSEQELPESSLSYMLSRFVTWFGAPESCYVWRDGQLDLSLLCEVLARAAASNSPVALLGTSFAFVHAMDGLAEQRFALPAQSRIMQTGGFKGRSREIDATSMRTLLSERFGIPDPFIVSEYGMTELSSQLYETTLRDACLGQRVGARRLWAPGWVRATPVHPESLVSYASEEPGLVRLDDAANLDSVSFIQTADLGTRVEEGLVILGRATGAVARGCSITADELLKGSHGRA